MANYHCLVVSVVIILLALDCSSVKCDQGTLGTETETYMLLQSDTKFVLGRKMLQGNDGKSVYIQGKNNPTDLDKSFPEAKTEKNRVRAQQHSITQKRDESKTFEEAADEVANLMRKDYKGMARRKPPINNHVPKD